MSVKAITHVKMIQALNEYIHLLVEIGFCIQP